MAFKDVTARFVFLLVTATIGSFLFGFHLAELNAPISVISCQISAKTTIASLSLPQCIPMNELEKGLVSSIFTLGGLCGALGAGRFSQNAGRYKTMLGTTVFHILGPVIEALSFNVGIFSLGRIISGVGAGAALVVVPIYIAELAPPSEKGFFGAFTQVTTNVGILVAQLLGLFLSRGSLWRVILAAGGVFGAAQAVGLLVGGQESPKWLADHGQPIQAKKVLRMVRGHAVDVEAEVKGWGISSQETQDAEEETLLNNDPSSAADSVHEDEGLVENVKDAVKNAPQQILGPLQVFRHPHSRPAVLIVMVVMIIQQFTGINSVVMYGVDVLRDSLGGNSALLNVGVSALNVVVTTCSGVLMDKAGRRFCLLLSIAVMSTASLFIGVGIMNHIPILAAVAIITFVAGFAIGLGPIPFILSSELVNTEAVGATQSWALAANWLSTFVVAQFFPVIQKALDPGRPYFIFMVVGVLSFAFVATFLPESKGKSTADEVWGRKRAGSERED